MTDDEQRPVLDQVNLVTADMAAAVAFYRLLGVEVQDPPAPWGPHHRAMGAGAGLDADLDSSAFASVWASGLPPGWTGAVVGFRVPSREAVDEVHRRLTGAGHPSLQAPYDAFWGARYAVVADPDGTPIGLMSPADDEHRTPPPTPPT